MTITDFVIQWNNRFQLDRWWRKKYNISFNSPSHRESCLIDILFEYKEEKVIQQYFDDADKEQENKKLYKEGIWLKDAEVSKQEEDAIFNKLLKNFNSGPKES